MPRRATPNAFSADRAATPEVTAQPSLSTVLPRVPPTRSAPAAPSRPKPSATGEREPKSAGGVVTAARPVAARIPIVLYDRVVPLIKGPGRPTLGQLISWTCEDSADEVDRVLTEAIASATSPRRLRGASRSAEATVQVTPRLREEELAPLDEIRARHPEFQVTRTMVVTAAVSVACARAQPDTE